MKSSSPLTVIIHTKNEAKNIAACIATCKHIVDEILVVDMHSTDDTVEIAKKLGARILRVADSGFVEPARELAIKKAKNPWILILDADERLPVALQRKITQLISQAQYDVVCFPFKNILLGKWIRHSMRWPDYHARLFQKGFVEWSSAVHGGHSLQGRILTLPATESNAFIHYNVLTVSQFLEKLDRYTSVERFYESLPEVSAQSVYRRVQGEFNWREYEHAGIQDGMHGFITNKLMEYYRFVEFAKYWERQGCPELFTREDIEKWWPPLAVIDTRDISTRVFSKIRERFKKYL